MAPVQAALRRSSMGSSCQPAAYHSRARSASNSTSRMSPAGGVWGGGSPPGGGGVWGGPAPPEVSKVNTELGQVLGGQVDPPVLMVLADVAQDVGQLQGDAERIGQAGRLLLVVARVIRPRAEDAQRQPSDRAGHAAAVVV